MKRISFAVIGGLIALTGCTAPAAEPAASPTQATASAPTATGTPLVGGCGDTPLWTGAPPDWIASAGGVGPLPYALSHEGNLFAGLFANPLRAGTDVTNPSNKILWIAREPRNGQPMKLTLRRTDGTGQVVTQEEPANSSPGEIYPSIVDVPSAGCWTVTAEWSGNRATLELPWL
jgi:hypothetical protein